MLQFLFGLNNFYFSIYFDADSENIWSQISFIVMDCIFAGGGLCPLRVCHLENLFVIGELKQKGEIPESQTCCSG